MTEKIDQFKGKYRFLSNYYDCDVIVDGLLYSNSEAAFHAQKCTLREEQYQFMRLNPAEAKRLGRRVKLRSDWELIKSQMMYAVVKAKFQQNPLLKKKLLDTGKATLIEGNTWGDRYWGQVNGEGKNMLGKILMRVREELGGYGELEDS